MLCQYNNLYIKGKKGTNGRKKKTVITVATMQPDTVANVKKKRVPHQISTLDKQ